MLFNSTDQIIALAIVLLAGWLLGLASHPGSRRWRERYAAERDAHAVDRKEADAQLASARARIVELERGATIPVVAAPPARPAVVWPIAAPAGSSARGWFDFPR